MNVLVACEYSAIVRSAFEARGHYALSCDFERTEVPGCHYQGDVRQLLGLGWDLMIAHPPCTRLCNSGVRWLHERDLWPELDMAAKFFRDLLNAPIPRICVENPIPHKYALDRIGEKYTQIIQPWQFGHGETKATCLWLKNLPNLVPTSIVDGREPRIHKMGKSPDRGKERSRFYEGIALAMADQWT